MGTSIEVRLFALVILVEQLRLSIYTGAIVRWESSTNGGGSSWTNINNASTTQSYSNLTQTTIYRVLLTLNNGCDGYSWMLGIIPVNEPFTPVTANPPLYAWADL